MHHERGGARIAPVQQPLRRLHQARHIRHLSSPRPMPPHHSLQGASSLALVFILTLDRMSDLHMDTR